MPYVGREANSFTTVVDVTVSDDLTVTDDATIGGTALVTGVLTTTAATVFNGGFASNAGSTISTADNSTALNIVSTDADENTGPRVDLTRNSASPAANDYLGQIRFMGEDAADNSLSYVSMFGQLLDPTDGGEDGSFELDVRLAGTNRSRIISNATETVFNDDSVDLDFRVESNGNANMLFVDGGNNRVGIGTGTPDATFSVAGSLKFQITAPAPVISGVNNNADSLLIDTSSSVANTDSLMEAANNGTVKFVIEGNGDVQSATNSYGAISDVNLKENIADANSQWDDIKAVRVRNFSMIADNLDKANQLGVVAQELEASGMNGLVKTKERNSIKSVKYSILYMKAVKALQEAMTRIETLETKVKTLEDA